MRPLLTWPGKDRLPKPPPHRLAITQAEGERSENLLIHGDNLAALHALAPTLRGAVRCAYLDPPYNTGADAEHYDDRYEHAAWLSSMHALLLALRPLLRPDGAVFVHLDGEELDYLKIVMDEVFGRANHLGRITVAARSPSAFSTVNPGVFKASEYLLWYAADRGRFRENPIRVPRPLDPAYTTWLDNPDDPPERWTFTTLKKAFRRAHGLNPRERIDPQALQDFAARHARQVCRLASISDTRAGRSTVEAKRASRGTPDRVLVVDRGPDLPPRYVLRGQQLVFYDRNVAVVDGRPVPTAPLTDIWTDIAWEGIAAEGGVRFKKGKKPERLLQRCLQLCTDPGDLVLDPFAGSGTTGAVAHKMARRWIMVERGPQCMTHALPRMRAVVAGEDDRGVTKATGWSGGGGFRVGEVQEDVGVGG